MKKLKILLLATAGVIVILCVAAFIAIKVFLPQDKIRTYITDYAKNNFNREISFDNLSFTLIGINLEHFKMSEKATFNEGTFIKSDKFTIKIALLPLLSKKIEVGNVLFNSIDINVTKDKDGKFNFDDMIKNSVKTTENNDKNEKKGSNYKEQKSFSVTVKDFTIKDANIKFIDLQDELEANIKNFNMTVHDFSFTDIFSCTTSFETCVKQKNLTVQLPLSAKFKTNLNDFDTDKLFLKIESVETNYNDAVVSLSGTVEGINIPKIDCDVTIKNITEKTFTDFFKSKQSFNIDEINFKMKSVIDIVSMTATVENLSLVLPNSSSNLSGIFNWGKKDLEYDIKLNLDLLIDEFTKFIPDYNPKGKLKTNLSATQNFLQGNLSLENVSLQSSYGTFSSFNADADLILQNKNPLHKIDFKNFEIDTFLLNMNKSSLKYNDAQFSLKGKIENNNKNNLMLNLNLDSKNVTDKTLTKFYVCPVKFILPSVTADSVAQLNLKNNSATITKLNIKLPDSSATVSGKLNWNNKKSFVYNLSLNLDLVLDTIAKNFPEYNMKGKIKSDAKISDKDFSGSLICTNLSFDYVPVAKVSKLNLQAEAKSKNNITIKSVSGIFNDGTFKADGSLINKDIKLNFDMDKLTIKTSSQAATQKAPAKETSKTQTANSQQDFNYNLYATVNINEIKVPYLTSKNASLKTSLKSVTATMQKADGTINLYVNEGKISDVNKLTQNKAAKTFLSLFNILNNNRTEATKANSQNDISFQKINCDVSFSSATVKLNDVSIKMPVATIKATGTVNLKNENLNIAVTAGNYTDMKVAGTMSNPKISYDVASALTNLLQDSGIGDTLKNLFNKNEKK